PYIKQDEPLKLECQHFLECIREQSVPVTNGRLGLEVVRILEAAGNSLRQQGAAIPFGTVTAWNNLHGNGKGNGHGTTPVTPTPNRTMAAA
ncbi:MAG TPA: hypothetical protein VNT26_12975, partial [Candidatus Sulfotelmatobacter sp.]|nr:hypothetical protein [Candidatus Sulfotelmatobacter sp.]